MAAAGKFQTIIFDPARPARSASVAENRRQRQNRQRQMIAIYARNIFNF
jgi:hypothetical protein